MAVLAPLAAGSFAVGNGWGALPFALAGAAAILIGANAIKFRPAYTLFRIRISKADEVSIFNAVRQVMEAKWVDIAGYSDGVQMWTALDWIL
jgi:hypothetical protein